MTTPLGEAVQFFKDFGLFDVVLPFLLVFTITFAILEKTRILGSEKKGSEELPKRTLNTMVAFVVGMLVIATNEIVNTINSALPNVILLLVVIVSFLMLIGVFYKEGSFDFGSTEYKKWRAFFVLAIFIIIVLIFLNSIQMDSGMSWLDYLIDQVVGPGLGSPVGAAIIFLIILIIGIVYVSRGRSGSQQGN